MSKLTGAKKDLADLAAPAMIPHQKRILTRAVRRIDELERLLIDIATAAENEAFDMAGIGGIGRTRRAIRRIGKMLGDA